MCNRLHASNGCSRVISAVRIRPSADIGADLSLCRRHNGNAKRTHWSSSPQTLRPCALDFVPLKEHRQRQELIRDKGLVVLVGQKKAIAIAVRNGSGRRRWSKTNGFGSGGPARHSLRPGRGG